MKIIHYEKNFHYTDAEMLYTAKRIGKLATYCKRLKDESSSITIEVEVQDTIKAKDALVVVVIIELPGAVLKADSRKATLLEAMDRAVEKLEVQVRKYKEKAIDKKKK